jgi:hypothetical protein
VRRKVVFVLSASSLSPFILLSTCLCLLAKLSLLVVGIVQGNNDDVQPGNYVGLTVLGEILKEGMPFSKLRQSSGGARGSYIVNCNKALK